MQKKVPNTPSSGTQAPNLTPAGKQNVLNTPSSATQAPNLTPALYDKYDVPNMVAVLHLLPYADKQEAPPALR